MGLTENTFSIKYHELEQELFSKPASVLPSCVAAPWWRDLHRYSLSTRTSWWYSEIYLKCTTRVFTATNKSLGVSNLTDRAGGTRSLFETRSFVLWDAWKISRENRRKFVARLPIENYPGILFFSYPLHTLPAFD
jgi:hypothetical protein